MMETEEKTTEEIVEEKTEETTTEEETKPEVLIWRAGDTQNFFGDFEIDKEGAREIIAQKDPYETWRQPEREFDLRTRD